MKQLLTFLFHFSVLLTYAQETAVVPYNGDSSAVFLLNDDYPDFPGGQYAKKLFIDSNLVYPDYALTQGLEGNCFVKFVVEKDGAPTNIKVMRGVVDCPDCDREAVRLVKLMPQWKPGTLEGKPVRSYYNLCVTFKTPQGYVISRDGGQSEYVTLQEDVKMVVLLDESPDFTADGAGLRQFITTHLNYPERALREGLTGKCYTQFTVSADGSVINPKVMHGVPNCPECDIEALRVIQSMPKWKQGSMAKRIIPTTYNLPISFTIKE